jgi:hypothetical protein
VDPVAKGGRISWSWIEGRVRCGAYAFSILITDARYAKVHCFSCDSTLSWMSRFLRVRPMYYQVIFWFPTSGIVRSIDPSNHSGVILFGVCRGFTVVRLIFRFYTPRLWDVSACPHPLPNGRKLDRAILPLEDLSFPGLADVSYVKLLAALAAFPAVVIILNVLSQLVCVLRLPRFGGIYLTCCLLASASRQESPSSRFPLGTHCRLRCRVWNGPYGIL